MRGNMCYVKYVARYLHLGVVRYLPYNISIEVVSNLKYVYNKL